MRRLGDDAAMPRCRPAGGGPRQPVRGMSGRAARYFQRAHRACDEGRDGDSALGPRPRRRPNHQPLCSGAGEGRAVCTRLAMPVRACRVRSLRGGGRSGHVIRIPSDSRHLLGLWQVLLRRGKQIFGAGATVGRSATGSAPKSPMPQDPSPCPSLLVRRALLIMARPSATPANDRLRAPY